MHYLMFPSQRSRAATWAGSPGRSLKSGETRRMSRSVLCALPRLNGLAVRKATHSELMARISKAQGDHRVPPFR